MIKNEDLYLDKALVRKFFIINLAFFLVGICLFYYTYYSGLIDTSVSSLLMAISILFMVPSFVLFIPFLIRIFSKEPEIILNDNGMYYRSLFYIQKYFEWRNIRKIYFANYQERALVIEKKMIIGGSTISREDDKYDKDRLIIYCFLFGYHSRKRLERIAKEKDYIWVKNNKSPDILTSDGLEIYYSKIKAFLGVFLSLLGCFICFFMYEDLPIVAVIVFIALIYAFITVLLVLLWPNPAIKIFKDYVEVHKPLGFKKLEWKDISQINMEKYRIGKSAYVYYVRIYFNGKDIKLFTIIMSKYNAYQIYAILQTMWEDYKKRNLIK